ncbi:MAG: DUF3237 domain-containing protein [Alphaproteobacteria bacterium]|jgi:hypothetical protein|nr:DUF3237 domain-containing protein [Alphaproteobacteria bacterium]
MMPLKSEFLMQIRVELEGSHFLGNTPYGDRRIDFFNGGTFEGPRLKGIVLPGGSDMQLGRADGARKPDVRLTLKTDDDALIQVTYSGIRHGSAEVMKRIAREEQVDPEEYYLRNTPYFETSADKYEWLNLIVAVGIGARVPDAAIYDIHQIL